MRLQIQQNEWRESCRLISCLSQIAGWGRELKLVTARALIARQWVECVERREVRDGARYQEDGTIIHTWTRYTAWEITDRGRKALNRTSVDQTEE